MAKPKKPLQRLRKYLVAGVLLIGPLGLSLWVLRFIVRTADSVLTVNHGRFLYFIPERFHPDALIGFHIPGLGVIAALIIVLAAGAIAHNVVGKRLIQLGEEVMKRIPLVSSVYNALKQLLGTVLDEESRNFRDVVLVEFPSPGIWSMGFVTGDSFAQAQAHFPGERMINIFVPTTPNPTTGFYIMVPERRVKPLMITTEEAFKLIMSFGIVTPELAAVSVNAGKNR